jgi:hypothetical protein
MRGFIAALIAIAILWAIDLEMNNSRYTNVIKRAAFSLIGR